MNVHPDKTAHRAVDACGGTHPLADDEFESGWQKGFDDGLEAACEAVKKPDALMNELLAALAELAPTNISTSNPNIADSMVVPCDVTIGELRRARAAITKATGEA